ncbi:thioesterase [Actinomadura sp. KC345]|uniref:thioesterase family protein n=1 Tax=Actinomadura sp. KC345 TaxID=2530371 RepID=UPI00104B7773|nr:thioesterase [Actinomadura sp. KC345]TDC50764.1 thioesterase [Actinomadura sp. KC345]
MELRAGARAELSVVVEESDTAVSLGSGDVRVLATPRLLALAEEATVQAIALDESQTSVGTRVELTHVAASPVGMRVAVAAELVEVDGARLVFDFTAADARGVVVGSGRVERVVVDRGRFLARLPRPERG